MNHTTTQAGFNERGVAHCLLCVDPQRALYCRCAVTCDGKVSTRIKCTIFTFQTSSPSSVKQLHQTCVMFSSLQFARAPDGHARLIARMLHAHTPETVRASFYAGRARHQTPVTLNGNILVMSITKRIHKEIKN